MFGIGIILGLALVAQMWQIRLLRKIDMSTTSSAQALADLQNAVASIQTAVTALQQVDAQIDAAVTAVEAQLQNAGVSPSAIEAVVTQIQSIQTSVAAVNTDLTTQANTLNPPAAGSAGTAAQAANKKA